MKTFLSTHPWMKLLSFGLAFLLWFSVRSEQQVEKSVNVRLKIIDVPRDLVLAEEVDTSITIHLTGPRTRIARVDEDYFKPYVVDLSEARKGVNTIWLYEDQFRIPRGTRITRIFPQRIRLRLDVAEERLVKVEPRFVGELSEGYALGTYKIEPEYVKVRGAKGEISGLSSVKTEPISLSGRTESFQGDYSVRARGLSWDLQDQKVIVKVQILEKVLSKIIDEVPVVVADIRVPVKVDPEQVAIRAKGPAGKVLPLLVDKLFVQITAEQLEKAPRNQKKLQIRPKLPEIPDVKITMIPEKVSLSFLPE